MSRKRRIPSDASSGSMADIAFLLLIFFMVTTTIATDKGLGLLLPSIPEEMKPAELHERNIFKIHINSDDNIMIEGEPRLTTDNLRNEIERFILNFGREENLSDNPQKAVVSIKTNRGTSQGAFIKMLDEAKAAYYNIYARNSGITPEQFRNLSLRDVQEKKLYEKGRNGIPMRISIAEPER